MQLMSLYLYMRSQVSTSELKVMAIFPAESYYS